MLYLLVVNLAIDLLFIYIQTCKHRFSIKLSYLLVVNLAIDLLFIYMQTCKRRCCYQTCVAVLLLDLYFSRWVAMSSQTYILYVTSPRTSSQFRQAHACSKQLKPVRNEPRQTILILCNGSTNLGHRYILYVTAPQASSHFKPVHAISSQ